MPKKRKKSKESPGSDKIESKRQTTMAQNGAQNGQQTMTYNMIPPNGQNGQTPVNQTSYNQMFQPVSTVSTLNYGQQIPMTPTFQQQNQQNQHQTMSATSPSQSDQFSIIIQRLETMERKLSQLDVIQTSVSSLTVHMQSLDQKINQVETKLSDLENSRAFDSSLLDEINKKQKQMDSLLNKMQTYENEHREREEGLKQEILDLQCRSMRDNLLFYRLPEEKDENCENKILDFIENQLKVENAKSEIKLHRAHRIGKYNSSKVRPIVAKFAMYPDKERVRKAAKNLNGTPYGISEQFPSAVMEKRRKLVPIMKQARQEGKEAYIRIDKLYINRREYTENV